MYRETQCDCIYPITFLPILIFQFHSLTYVPELISFGFLISRLMVDKRSYVEVCRRRPIIYVDQFSGLLRLPDCISDSNKFIMNGIKKLKHQNVLIRDCWKIYGKSKLVIVIGYGSGWLSSESECRGNRNGAASSPDLRQCRLVKNTIIKRCKTHRKTLQTLQKKLVVSNSIRYKDGKILPSN